MSNKQKESQYSKQNLSDNDRALYWQLFVNRTDVYAIQTPDGRYTCIESPLTQEILLSDQTVGTYNLDHKSHVINACLDFDLLKSVHEQKDSMPEAEWSEWLEKINQFTQAAFRFIRSLGIPCYLEFSGYKGYHIWMFFDKPMPAADVRQWMKHLKQLLPVIPEAIDIEIFPKQDAIRDGGYGNFVKLPLQKHLKSRKYTHFLNNEFKPVVGLPKVTRTALVALPELPEKVKNLEKPVEHVQNGKKPDSKGQMHLERLEGIIKHCEYMQKLKKRIEDDEHLNHEERIWTGNLLLQFGMENAIAFYKPASDFDPVETHKQLSSLNGIPSTCDSAPMCSNAKCPLMKRLGKKSPIVFAKRVRTQDDIDPELPWMFYNMKAQRHHYLYRGEQLGVSKEDKKVIFESFGMTAPTKEISLLPIFDPHSPTYIDLVDHTINFFTPTEYMKLKKTSQVLLPTKDFPTILQLLSNNMPEPDELEEFINWLATIFNTLKKMRTSFVFKGAQGAGKNAMFEHVIAPLLGKAQCRVVKNEELESQFNPYMRGAFFIAFDEIAHNNSSRNRVNSKLKAYITDDKVTINDKNDKTYVSDNRMNCVFFSNEAIPLIVEGTDRRFSVIRTGENLAKQTYFDGDKFFKRIQAELASFAQYLRNFPYDESKANTAMDNTEKAALAAAGMGKIEEFATKLKENDGQWLMDAVDKEYGFLYSPSFPAVLSNEISRSETKKLYQAIYGEEISTQTLSKKLAVHGISTKKNTEWVYTW